MKKRILITGGSGLLGLNWGRCKRDDFDVTLGIHKRTFNLYGVTTAIFNIDILADVLLKFSELKPDIVIHTAGLTNVEKCELNPDLAQHVNVTLASNVSTACEVLGIKLVHISTDHLFDGKKTFSTENCPVSPMNVYAKTKEEAERVVRTRNTKSLVIRTNFYGWGTYYRHSFSDDIITALEAKKEIFIFDDVFYTPILAETLIQAVHELILLNAEGVFHVVGDQRISKYSFALSIAKRFNLDSSKIIPSQITNKRNLTQRPRDMSLDNQKVCKMLDRRLGGLEADLERLHAQKKDWLLENG